jgi:serine/threonine protein kinase
MTDRVGQQLGNYQLMSLLGHGGFADVYLGEHVYLHTQAAIKVLHTVLASDDIEQFRTEALTIAHLIHPHIVRVLDFDVDNNVPFLVMDYAPNGNLRQRHPKGSQLPPAIILPYIKQVASALQYAHDRKLIHRDVKPENMLVGQTNDILLSDFGIALVSQNSLSQSTEQNVIGTVAYMAPEQIQGKARPASDQYSLAIVVYEWLSGHKPFNGSYVEVVTQHLSTAPPPLNTQALGIPPAVAQVVRKALVKNPHERFARVEDFAAALEQAFQAKKPAGAIFPAAGIAAQDREPKQPTVMVMPPVATQPIQEAQQVYRPDTPPPTPFPSSKPAHIHTSARKVKRGLKIGFRIAAIGVVLLAVLVCGLSYAAYHFLTAPHPLSNTTQATTMANAFVQDVSQHKYNQAYNEFAPSLANQESRGQFDSQAVREDSCYGPVTNFHSNGSTQQGSTLNYTYLITRQKLPQSYQLHLSLQQNSSGNWQIANYNSNISSQGTCQ